MKKSMLAMSVAAAIGGLGFAGSALAIGTLGGQGATASVLQLSADGIGHKLVVPYFSTQNGNVTLINVVNTDTINGKLVKVRFRGAGNSDDLLDFQVLMSPGDVWTASVTQDADSKLSKLSTSDASCTVGLGARAADGTYSSLFSTLRTDRTKAEPENETREGYVEMMNMADVPPATGSAGVDTLYEAIKHVNGVAPCTTSIIDAALGTDPANEAEARLRGMNNPSTGLTGDWILLNQTTTAAWSGGAQSMEARVSLFGEAGLANIAFWPQKFGTPTNVIASVTADPLLRLGSAGVAPQFYDLPDLSTPYVTGATTAEEQADQNTIQFAVNSIKNQFETSTGIAAVTDWLFSQPTRRYHVAVDYNGTGTAEAVFRSGSVFLPAPAGETGTAFYHTGNTRLHTNRQVCLDTTKGPGRNSLFDREETTPGEAESPFVPSPNVPENEEIVLLCGEANVISFNANGVTAPSALSASVARVDISTDYSNGWASWDLGNGGFGVPVVGQSFMRAANGPVNYGFAFPHKKERVFNFFN